MLSEILFLQNADYMTAQIFDLTDKLEQSENHLGRGSFVSSIDGTEKTEDKLTKATKDRLVFPHYFVLPACLIPIGVRETNISCFIHIATSV